MLELGCRTDVAKALLPPEKHLPREIGMVERLSVVPVNNEDRKDRTGMRNLLW